MVKMLKGFNLKLLPFTVSKLAFACNVISLKIVLILEWVKIGTISTKDDGQGH